MKPVRTAHRKSLGMPGRSYARRLSVEKLEERQLLAVSPLSSAETEVADDTILAGQSIAGGVESAGAGGGAGGLGASIHGTKWHDLNGNSVRDAGEPGLEGWTIFLDRNGNGVLDSGGAIIASTDVPKTALATTVFSTLPVSGLSGTITDVNVTLDISHTWDSDAEVFLISPSGTRVELFTSVGGSGDNFTDTTLDDEAATPIGIGAAPFSGSFRPEGLLSDFDGENPNGVWQLEFTDVVTADSGTLNSWSLAIEVVDLFSSSDVPQTALNSTVFSELTVSGVGATQDVDVTLDISHTWDSDAEVYLISPAGTRVALFSGVGGSNDNFMDTTLDDEATTPISSGIAPFTGRYRPQGLLSDFDGENPNGVWLLEFTDNVSADAGTLNSWSLSIIGGELVTKTDADGNYAFVDLPPGEYAVREVQQPGWMQTSPAAAAEGSIQSILNQLNERHAEITALVPDRYDFTEGETGTYIEDGGNDMYDFGNYLNTDLATAIPYTNGVVTAGDSYFGTGSQYFTAKYPGLFVMVATDVSIDSFETTGDTGADGSGMTDHENLFTTVDDKEYAVFLKRTYGTSDPSINHLIIAPRSGGVEVQQSNNDTNDDFHQVGALGTRNELYYLLVARANGGFLEETDALNIANEFLTNLSGSGDHSFTLAPGESVLGVDFGNRALPGSIHGQKWHDVNGNGVKEVGEPGLADWMIYLDNNDNGHWDNGSGTFAATDVPQSALDSTVISALAVNVAGTIVDVNVTIDITHTWDSDAEVYLISPSGTRVELFTNVGGSGDNFSNTTLDDEAATSITIGTAPFSGAFRPEGLLSSFDGESMSGIWQLEFTDIVGSDSGILNSWSLEVEYLERATTTDANGNYQFLDVPAGEYAVAENEQAGWTQTQPGPPGLALTLNNFNANHAAVTARVPDRYDFTDGATGNNIFDGGDDMYDIGNFLNTDLAVAIPYTNGVIMPGDGRFGPGSRYFTAKYPGLFVMAADDVSINTFEITGNNGADGGGSVDGDTLSTIVRGRQYTIFVKRVYGTTDPSINHVIIVPGDAFGVFQVYSTDTDNDLDSVSGLSSVDEIYYALVARDSGGYLENDDVLNIANELLANLSISSAHFALVEPGQDVLDVDFGNVQLPLLLGDYNQNGTVDAADYTRWRDTLGQSVPNFSGADGSGNGLIDQDDHGVWKAHFGETFLPGSGSLSAVSALSLDTGSAAMSLVPPEPIEVTPSETRIVPSAAPPLDSWEPSDTRTSSDTSPRSDSRATQIRELFSWELAHRSRRSIQHAAEREIVGPTRLSLALRDDALLAWLSSRNETTRESDDVNRGTAAADRPEDVPNHRVLRAIDEAFDRLAPHIA